MTHHIRSRLHIISSIICGFTTKTRTHSLWDIWEEEFIVALYITVYLDSRKLYIIYGTLGTAIVCLQIVNLCPDDSRIDGRQSLLWNSLNLWITHSDVVKSHRWASFFWNNCYISTLGFLNLFSPNTTMPVQRKHKNRSTCQESPLSYAPFQQHVTGPLLSLSQRPDPRLLKMDRRHM